MWAGFVNHRVCHLWATSVCHRVVHDVGDDSGARVLHVVVHGGRRPDMSYDRVVVDDRDGLGWAAEVLDGRALQ